MEKIRKKMTKSYFFTRKCYFDKTISPKKKILEKNLTSVSKSITSHIKNVYLWDNNFFVKNTRKERKLTNCQKVLLFT